MRRTEQLQGLRLMKFEDVYGRCYRGDLSQAEASEILGMLERTFRRWRERYEAEGAEGLYDRRLGRVSARRAPVDEVMRVLELFETRYPDFTAKHFHEKLVCEHGFGLRYNWLRLSLQAHGKIKPAPRRGAHRRKRPRRPVVGMMLHQDGSSHEWVAVRWPRKIGQVFKVYSPDWTHPGKVEAPYTVCIASASNLTGLVKSSVECRRTGL